jgi:hypothetical protein
MTQTTQNANSIKKAAKIKCSVRQLPGRAYLVTTPKGHRYTVRMEMYGGERYAVCNCAAGAVGMSCYHISHAANVDDLRFDGRTLASAQPQGWFTELENRRAA